MSLAFRTRIRLGPGQVSDGLGAVSSGSVRSKRVSVAEVMPPTATRLLDVQRRPPQDMEAEQFVLAP